MNSVKEKNGTKKNPARPAAYCNPSRAVRVGIAPRKVSESGTFQTFVRETSKLELEKPKNTSKSGAKKTPISKFFYVPNFAGSVPTILPRFSEDAPPLGGPAGPAAAGLSGAGLAPPKSALRRAFHFETFR